MTVFKETEWWLGGNSLYSKKRGFCSALGCWGIFFEEEEKTDMEPYTQLYMG